MGLQSQTGFLAYIASLTQTSTTAPVATVQQNDFSALATLTWARTSAGFYTLTASKPIFTSAKTRVKLGSVKGLVEVTSITSTVITIKTYDDAASIADVKLLNTAIEVQVWN